MLKIELDCPKENFPADAQYNTAHQIEKMDFGRSDFLAVLKIILRNSGFNFYHHLLIFFPCSPWLELK
jgi:hypothetical protein